MAARNNKVNQGQNARQGAIDRGGNRKAPANNRRRVNGINSHPEVVVPEPAEHEDLLALSPFGIQSGSHAQQYTPRRPVWDWLLYGNDPDSGSKKGGSADGAEALKLGSGQDVGKQGQAKDGAALAPASGGFTGPKAALADNAGRALATIPAGPKGDVLSRAAKAQRAREDASRRAAAFMEKLESYTPSWAKDSGAHRTVRQSHATLRRIRLALEVKKRTRKAAEATAKAT